MGHYRNPLDLTEEALEGAMRGYARLLTAARAVRRQLGHATEGEADAELLAMLAASRAQFEASMDDDFNTPGAIAALFDLTREVNTRLNSGQALTRGSLEAIDTLLARLAGDVLGVLPQDLEAGEDAGTANELIALLAETRRELRTAKQWALADGIRNRLAELGIQLQDTADGTTWTRS
jgi:cysteinyl-tRNA synthetase